MLGPEKRGRGPACEAGGQLPGAEREAGGRAEQVPGAPHLSETRNRSMFAPSTRNRSMLCTFYLSIFSPQTRNRASEKRVAELGKLQARPTFNPESVSPALDHMPLYSPLFVLVASVSLSLSLPLWQSWANSRRVPS